MRIYVIRHGESRTNRDKLWTGWLDVPLTDKGRADARKAGEFLKGISFDKVYTSDLSRAIETAETALPGCCYETSPLLREINVGTLAGKPLPTLTAPQRERIAKEGYTEFDGETNAAFYSRICAFKDVLEDVQAENVAVFSHAGWMRGLLDTVVGMRLPRNAIRCENCTVAVYDCADGQWKLHSWVNL